MSRRTSKIDFFASGELAEKVEAYIELGLYADKPELVRDALRHLFEHLEEAELLNTRRRLMQQI